MGFLPWRKPKPPVSGPAPSYSRVISYQCAGCQGIGSRERQEDAWALVNAEDVTQIRQSGLLALVADGMGGMQGGAQASAVAVQTMVEDFQRMDRTQPLAPQLTDSLRRANQRVYDLLRGAGGSTAVACVCFDEQLFYAGVGDSFLYLLRQGQLIRLNREQNVLHRCYQDLIRRGCVDPSLAQDVPQKQAVTQFLGLDQLDEIDWLRRALPLQDGDVLLLCSDGVGGVLSPGEISVCLNLPYASDACGALQEAILGKRRPDQDNFTAVVIRCGR